MSWLGWLAIALATAIAWWAVVRVIVAEGVWHRGDEKLD